jgi:hypothetical protein
VALIAGSFYDIGDSAEQGMKLNYECSELNLHSYFAGHVFILNADKKYIAEKIDTIYLFCETDIHTS